DRIHIDCTGTSAQAPAVINTTAVYSRAAIYAGIISLVDPDGVLNSGSLDLIDVDLEEGTILNPTYPAPVAAGNYALSAVLSECAVRALADVFPQRVAASSHGDRDNSTLAGFHPDTGGEWIWYAAHHGGCGARATRDG